MADEAVAGDGERKVALEDASLVKEEGARQLVEVDGRHLALMRHRGHLHAVDATCYHMGGPLLLGDIEDVKGVGPCLTCPWHHYQISLRSGARVYHDIQRQCKTMPHRQRIHSVSERHNRVLVRLSADSTPFESDRYAFRPPPPAQRSSSPPGAPPMKSGQVFQRMARSSADGKAPHRTGALASSGFSRASKRAVLLSESELRPFVIDASQQVARNVYELRLEAKHWSTEIGGLGKHLLVSLPGNKAEEKQLTPVVRFHTQDSGRSCETLSLIVKASENDTFSSQLATQQPSTTVLLKGPFGGTHNLFLAGARSIGMLAAETGISPMLQIVHSLLAKSRSGTIATMPRISLLCVNQTQSDIICRNELDRLQIEHNETVHVKHVLSHEPNDTSWDGLRGRVDHRAIFQEWDMALPNKGARLLICGPSDFSEEMEHITKEVWSEEQVFVF